MSESARWFDAVWGALNMLKEMHTVYKPTGHGSVRRTAWAVHATSADTQAHAELKIGAIG